MDVRAILLEPRRGRFASIIGAGLVFGALAWSHAMPASACSGGIAVDWAVEHEHGGISRATVLTVDVRPDYSNDLILANIEPLHGDPPPLTHVNTVAGAACDQSADPGETIVLIFDIRGGDPPIPLPLYYVVRGPDALEPGVVDELFGPEALASIDVIDSSEPANVPAVEPEPAATPRDEDRGAAPPSSTSMPLAFVAVAVALLFGAVVLLDRMGRRSH